MYFFEDRYANTTIGDMYTSSHCFTSFTMIYLVPNRQKNSIKMKWSKGRMNSTAVVRLSDECRERTECPESFVGLWGVSAEPFHLVQNQCQVACSRVIHAN